MLRGHVEVNRRIIFYSLHNLTTMAEVEVANLVRQCVSTVIFLLRGAEVYVAELAIPVGYGLIALPAYRH